MVLAPFHPYNTLYKDYTKWEDDKVNQDMQTSKRVLSDLAGQSPQLLRPPNGDFDKRILQIADKQGLSIIHWSVDSKDYTNPGVEKIVENTLSETRFPHSDIPASKLTYSSTRRFAVRRVLLRLLVPRHSPCALSNLTIFGCKSTADFFVNFVFSVMCNG